MLKYRIISNLHPNRGRPSVCFWDSGGLLRNTALFLLVLAASALLADSPSPGRKYTTVERLDPAHLEAVHRARAGFAAQRKVLPLAGVYNDYRAVLHVPAEDAPHTKGTRAEVLTASKP